MADNAIVYNIEFSDPLKDGIVILPGTTDVSTSLTLSGNGNLKWGEDFNESLLHVMEHFSNDSEPANGVEGQIWFNSTAQDLYLFAGVGSPVWSPLGIGPGALITPYVKKAGDTMTGNLVIEKSSPRIFLNSTDNTDSRVDFQENGITIGDLGFAAGSNDIVLQRRAGAGSPIQAVTESIALISGAGTTNVPFKLLAGDPVAPEDATRKQYVDDAISAGTSAAVPVGTVSIFAGAAAPTGYLICDGSARSRTVTYDALFAVINVLYGPGNGSSTFNIPDLRGRFPVGVEGGVGGTNRVSSHNTALGIVDGQEFHSLGASETPNHTHTATSNNRGSHTHTGSTRGGGAHSHGIFGHFQGDVTGGGSDDEVRPGGTTDPVGDHTHTINQLSTEPSHSHTITVNATTGGGSGHENTPPYVAINYIIKY